MPEVAAYLQSRCKSFLVVCLMPEAARRSVGDAIEFFDLDDLIHSKPSPAAGRSLACTLCISQLNGKSANI